VVAADHEGLADVESTDHLRQASARVNAAQREMGIGGEDEYGAAVQLPPLTAVDRTQEPGGGVTDTDGVVSGAEHIDETVTAAVALREPPADRPARRAQTRRPELCAGESARRAGARVPGCARAGADGDRRRRSRAAGTVDCEGLLRGDIAFVGADGDRVAAWRDSPRVGGRVPPGQRASVQGEVDGGRLARVQTDAREPFELTRRPPVDVGSSMYICGTSAPAR
jgi:hypothetical protein